MPMNCKAGWLTEMSIAMYARADLPLLRSPFSATLAMTVALALLLAFGLVVHQGVKQAALRQVEASAQTAAHWRCSYSKGALERADCLGVFQATRVASRGPAQ